MKAERERERATESPRAAANTFTTSAVHPRVQRSRRNQSGTCGPHLFRTGLALSDHQTEKLKERVIGGIYCIEALFPLSRIPFDCVFLLFLSADEARLISPTPAVPNLQLPDTRHYTPQPPPSLPRSLPTSLPPTSPSPCAPNSSQ